VLEHVQGERLVGDSIERRAEDELEQDEGGNEGAGAPKPELWRPAEEA
jgi:hypothetical protein